MKSKVLIFAVILILAGLIVFVVQQGAQNPTIEEENGTSEQDQPVPGSEGEDVEDTEVSRTVQVDGSEFSFNPSTITVNKGELVEFEFTNMGNISHDFRLRGENGAALGGTSVIPAGSTDSFTLQMPDEETVIEITSYCSVPGHEESGMTGTIVVQ